MQLGDCCVPTDVELSTETTYSTNVPKVLEGGGRGPVGTHTHNCCGFFCPTLWLSVTYFNQKCQRENRFFRHSHEPFLFTMKKFVYVFSFFLLSNILRLMCTGWALLWCRGFFNKWLLEGGFFPEYKQPVRKPRVKILLLMNLSLSSYLKDILTTTPPEQLFANKLKNTTRAWSWRPCFSNKSISCRYCFQKGFVHSRDAEIHRQSPRAGDYSCQRKSTGLLLQLLLQSMEKTMTHEPILNQRWL